MKITDLTQFIREAYKGLSKGFEGCIYRELGSGLYLVAALIKEDDKYVPAAKIAYNSDSLQSDYDYDWYMPSYKDGEVAYTEITLSKNNFRGAAEWFYKEFKSMEKEIKKNNLCFE